MRCNNYKITSSSFTAVAVNSVNVFVNFCCSGNVWEFYNFAFYTQVHFTEDILCI